MSAAITNPIALTKARLIDLQETVTDQANKLRKQATQRVETVVGTARDGGLSIAYAAGATALDGAATVGRLLPFGESLTDELERRGTALTDAGIALDQPSVENYDALNVKKASEALDALNAWELTKLHRYETAHKNRKTVLAAIDRRLG
jgi:hypothetical protein